MRSKTTPDFEFWSQGDEIVFVPRFICVRKNKIKGTRMENLIGKNPENLDARNLDLTPLEEFQTMGIDDYRINLEKRRLEIDGDIQRPLKLTYNRIIQMPSIEKNVL